MPGKSAVRVVLLAAAVVVGYLIFTTVNTTLQSKQLEQDEARMQQEVAQLADSREKLLAIREYLSSDEYIEGVARRVLGLVKPGETRVTVISPDAQPSSPEQEQQPGSAWWESLFRP